MEGQRLNTERALEFLRGDGVVLHPDACRGEQIGTEDRGVTSLPAADLLEGNVKGVMRVILAIAERYQPKSVKPRAAVDTFTARPLNHTAPVTDVALHSRPDLMRPYTHPQTGRPEQGQILSQSAGFHSSMYPSSYAVDPAQEGMYSCPIDQLPANKPPQVGQPSHVTQLQPLHFLSHSLTHSGYFWQEKGSARCQRQDNLSGCGWNVWNS